MHKNKNLNEIIIIDSNSLKIALNEKIDTKINHEI